MLTLAGNPDPAKYNSVAAILDGVVIAGPLTISAKEGTNQIFMISICSSRLNDRFAVQDGTNCPIRIGTPSC
ncbi:MAG TPA: hypothetical protein VKI44_26960, partial [Acetobacteraceae bacterium]|nr:hypothetical protein [Acetobacteraceae bacterium]